MIQIPSNGKVGLFDEPVLVHVDQMAFLDNDPAIDYSVIYTAFESDGSGNCGNILQSSG